MVKRLVTKSFTVGTKGITDRGRQLVRAAIYDAADTIAAEAAYSITEGSVSGARHVPSLPGEPPNADDRVLDKGITVDPNQSDTGGRITARVVSSAPYSAALEFGTGKMAARPFLRPAGAKVGPEAEAKLKQALAAAAKL